jgi:DNA-binding MarR family transcriptional regulator
MTEEIFVILQNNFFETVSPELKPNEIRFLMLLLSNKGYFNGTFTLYTTVQGKELGLSDSQTDKIVKGLKEKGYLVRVKDKNVYKWELTIKAKKLTATSRKVTQKTHTFFRKSFICDEELGNSEIVVLGSMLTHAPDYFNHACDLVNELGIKKNTMSGILTKLKEKGLILETKGSGATKDIRYTTTAENYIHKPEVEGYPGQKLFTTDNKAAQVRKAEEVAAKKKVQQEVRVYSPEEIIAAQQARARLYRR